LERLKCGLCPHFERRHLGLPTLKGREVQNRVKVKAQKCLLQPTLEG